uniref:SR-related CTD associated factor 1 n=1 Tax=Loxodonta africana TaxID=9785 RepID=G3UHU6_LOXAF
MEEDDESRGKTEESGEDRGDSPPDRDPTLSPSAFILRAIQQAVGSSLQGELSNEKDGSRCHGLGWKHCQSLQSEPRVQESGGTDTATVVLDMAADGFLAGLVNVLDPPDWVPSRLDLQPGESEDMLELVAEVHIGDRDPVPLSMPSLLPRLQAWRMGKTGKTCSHPTSSSFSEQFRTLGTGRVGPAQPRARSRGGASPSKKSISTPFNSHHPHPPPAPPAPPAPRFDIYDPFHPTDEAYSPPPAPEQKYDPFDPTGSNPSSSAGTPSQGLSQSISRISETLAGIYDDNSLSQDFPGDESPHPDPPPQQPAPAPGTPPQADSTRADGATRRRVFVVGTEAEACREGKVSVEVVTAGSAAFPPPLLPPADSEIEEGEIVQPEEEPRLALSSLFRPSSRARPPASVPPVAQPPPQLPAPRAPEGDDFLSLHAESDGEGALQVDLGEPAPAPPATDIRWGGLDLRRKILTQRRERYRQRSASPAVPAATAPTGPPARKKSKRDRKRHGGSAGNQPATPAPATVWDSKKHRSRDRKPGSHASSSSADRRRGGSRRSRSREKRRRRRRSASPPPATSSSSSSRRERHRGKHRDGGSSKKKKKRSRSRGEKRSGDGATEKASILAPPPSSSAMSGSERDSRRRGAVPPSIQDLTDHDLFAIKRTITVGRPDKSDPRGSSPAPTSSPKREVLYDSEGLSGEERGGKSSERDRRRSRAASSSREKGSRRKALDGGDRDRDRDRSSKKARPSKELVPASGPPPKPPVSSGSRKVKLQSKVAVLIREGVSSTTPAKEATSAGLGSIGVKFSRDRESRSPFLKPDERAPAEVAKAAPGSTKPKKTKVKAKAGAKKAKGTKGKTKPSKTRKKVRSGGSSGGGGPVTLKKSKADSCSQATGAKGAEETSWSGEERATKAPSTPPPKAAPPPPVLTPDSQTVDSSCKTPEVSFLPEEASEEAGVRGGEQPATTTATSTAAAAPSAAPSAGSTAGDSGAEDGPATRVSQLPTLPPPMPWNLPAGVDCTTSGVLALTALLFKMEEANLASRAKAQELIQATNQILSHRKPPSGLGVTPAPVPTSLGLPPGPSNYLLPGSLPLGGCGSTPPTPTGLAAASDKREGSSSSEGRGDTDKYLKKLHTQERAVEEVKLIKPYYQKTDITKEEYKDILRKAVHKICHSKSGEINPVKVSNLVRAYVQRYRYFRKHGRKPGDPPGPPRPPKEPGPPDKGGPGLPLPPL